jgi:hypothetical protein
VGGKHAACSRQPTENSAKAQGSQVLGSSSAWRSPRAWVTIGGPATQAFPIPTTLPLGTNLYTQALALDVVTSASSMSNGCASAVGF